MIRKNTIDCKLIQLKSSKRSAFSIFADTMSSFRPEDEVCPTCGRKGDCKPHASYRRYLIDFEDATPRCRMITVRRVICSCGSTHAILPDPVIPYDQYSLFYIIAVLAVYSCRLMTVERLCEAYAITPSMLYRWKSFYQNHRCDWQGVLKSTSSDIRHSLLELIKKNPYSVFAVSFIRLTNYSLLQSHANPANCQQNHQYDYFYEVSHMT